MKARKEPRSRHTSKSTAHSLTCPALALAFAELSLTPRFIYSLVGQGVVFLAYFLPACLLASTVFAAKPQEVWYDEHVGFRCKFWGNVTWIVDHDSYTATLVARHSLADCSVVLETLVPGSIGGWLARALVINMMVVTFLLIVNAGLTRHAAGSLGQLARTDALVTLCCWPFVRLNEEEQSVPVAGNSRLGFFLGFLGFRF